MRNKLIIGTVFIFIHSLFTCEAQKVWSLNDCIVYAIENNLEIKDFEIREKISRENLNQSKRDLLPGVNARPSAGISYGRSVDPITNDYITNDFFNNSYSIGTSITLFNGFRLQNQIQYQKLRKQETHFHRLNAVDDLAFNVMIYYFDVLIYKGLLEIAKEQVNTSKLHLKTTEKQVEVGLKAKSDMLEMRANLEMEELNVIQIENNIKKAMLNLKQQLNLATSNDLVLKNEIAAPISLANQNPHLLYSEFSSWSPHLKSFESSLMASRKGLSLYRSQLYPQIVASGSISSGFSETNKDADGEVISFNQQLKNNQSQYIGASLQIPIFNRWANRSDIKKAKLEIEQQQNRLKTEQQNLFFTVMNDINELQAYQKELLQYEKQHEADQLAFYAAEKKYENGLINIVEYYLAKNRMANTASQKLRVRLQWEIKKKTIDFYSGNRFWQAQTNIETE